MQYNEYNFSAYFNNKGYANILFSNARCEIVGVYTEYMLIYSNDSNILSSVMHIIKTEF